MVYVHNFAWERRILMKNLKIAVLGVLSMLLMAFLVFIPMNVKAATVENGQTVKLLNQGKQFYKFTLADDSLVQISWTNNKGSSEMFLYPDKERSEELRFISFNGEKGKTFVALAKGTYYFDMYDNNSKPATKVKFNWTAASTYSKGNYSLKKAQTLKADTIVHVVQVHKYDYTRWYKITLTKGQKLTIMAPYGNLYMPSIWDSKSNSVNLSCTNNTFSSSGYPTSYTTDQKLPKGTYYISIPMTDPAYKVGEYVAFKWK